MSRNIGIFYVLLLTISSCATVKNIAVETDIDRTLNQSPIFSRQFTGFSLYDIEEQKFIAGYNDTKHFTPASNVKLLTMYSTLKSFSNTDSLPGFLYEKRNGALMVQPMGDPTFLDSRFSSEKAFQLFGANDIRISWPKQDIRPFGSGWAWDDYTYDFHAQRSWWPIYGNMIAIVGDPDSVQITPTFFEDYVELAGNDGTQPTVERDIKYNIFKVNVKSDTSSLDLDIPFDYSKELLLELLKDTLQNTIQYTALPLLRPDTLYTQSLDHVLAVMMKASDNLLAEQLLHLAARENGYQTMDAFIKHAKLIWLSELTEFSWVDGSGLSRYNLISPVDLVRLLKLSMEEFGLERLQRILAVGGESGTIKDWYAAEEPYIYAKTGTLSNNHNLSGFLKTRSGKWMIFSFMNNNYLVSNSEVKTEMQKLLEAIRDTY